MVIIISGIYWYFRGKSYQKNNEFEEFDMENQLVPRLHEPIDKEEQEGEQDNEDDIHSNDSDLESIIELQRNLAMELLGNRHHTVDTQSDKLLSNIERSYSNESNLDGARDTTYDELCEDTFAVYDAVYDECENDGFEGGKPTDNCELHYNTRLQIRPDAHIHNDISEDLDSINSIEYNSNTSDEI